MLWSVQLRVRRVFSVSDVDAPLHQIESDWNTMVEVHGDLTHGPIPHASIQLANSMCFRTQHRTVNRSAPYSVVYRQERSRGPIINGNVSGDINFNMSNGDGTPRCSSLAFIYIMTVAYSRSTAIPERACGDWGDARL